MHSQLQLTQYIAEDVVFILCYEHKIQFETLIYKPKLIITSTIPHFPCFHLYSILFLEMSKDPISITVITEIQAV
jgi:hypothetical protein